MNANGKMPSHEARAERRHRSSMPSPSGTSAHQSTPTASNDGIRFAFVHPGASAPTNFGTMVSHTATTIQYPALTPMTTDSASLYPGLSRQRKLNTQSVRIAAAHTPTVRVQLTSMEDCEESSMTAVAHALPFVSFQAVHATSGVCPGAAGFHLMTSVATPSLPVSVTRSLTNPCSARSTYTMPNPCVVRAASPVPTVVPI